MKSREDQQLIRTLELIKQFLQNLTIYFQHFSKIRTLSSRVNTKFADTKLRTELGEI